MKAIVVAERGGPNVLQLTDTPRPSPGPGEVLLRAVAAGVNYADVMQHMGTYPLKLDPPYTPGMEVVGDLIEIGPGVEGLEVGARYAVISFLAGAYAEYVVAPAKSLAPVDLSLRVEDVLALMIQGVSAYALLDHSGRMKGGETVLVHAAAGGVGHLAVQIARLLKAKTIVGIAGGPEKQRLLKGWGIDHAIDHRSADWAQAAADAEVKADLILDPVGASAFEDNLRVLAPEGRIVSYGWLSGETPAISSARSLDMLFANQSLTGFALNVLMARHPQYVTDVMAVLTAWLADGHLKPLTGNAYALADAARAHDDLYRSRTSGKVTLTIA